MPPTPEDRSRINIDQRLEQAGWLLFDRDNADIDSNLGTIVRQFPLTSGIADYMIYVNGKCAGIIEAKPSGISLSGVEQQAAKYITGLKSEIPTWRHPLPFYYLSNGDEIFFYNGFSPQARSRLVFSFHTPQALLQLLQAGEEKDFLRLVGNMPAVESTSLWAAQADAVKNLETSLARGHRRALIQMATGSGKTYTAINFIYRLIKHANVKRVLFLTDRKNLGEQTESEFQQFSSPLNNRKFHQEYNIQRLTSNNINDTAKVCISTIQRLYAMLCGHELDPEAEERGGESSVINDTPKTVQYNPDIPIDFFDIIVVDECHRSIYQQWAQVLEYFDARIIGMTATPGKITFGFFNQNLVMEYPHERAVVDKVNVPFDIYRIRTAVSEQGGKVEAGYTIPMQNRQTRAQQWRTLDEDFEYTPEQIDRHVTVPDQIRTILTTFRDSIFQIFPGRTHMPKTVVFAKDDNHAEKIVEIAREVFDKGADFIQKITYRSTGETPQTLINNFRNSYHPRIAVTVDMIAVGTDIKPVEIVFFMRAVKSRTYFEQMKGRGVRVISPDQLQAVTPDAPIKDRFVIVDAVGVCEQEKTDTQPIERKPHVSFEKLLESVSFGNTEPDSLVSLAGRFVRLHNKLTPEDNESLKQSGADLHAIARELMEGADPNNHFRQAQKDREERGESGEPDEKDIQAAAKSMLHKAAQAVRKPSVRNAILSAKEKSDIVIDIITADTVIEESMNNSRANAITETFRQYIEKNKDEITALQILYSRPRSARLKFTHLEELVAKLAEPPHQLNHHTLWTAYATLQKDGRAGKLKMLTDLVSLVRFALRQDEQLQPFTERVNQNFDKWLTAPEREFNEEQIIWLEAIRDHIAGNLSLDEDDFDLSPFIQKGGLGQAHVVFGEDLDKIIGELNEHLVA